jgi:hypothetical protein
MLIFFFRLRDKMDFFVWIMREIWIGMMGFWGGFDDEIGFLVYWIEDEFLG